MKSLNLCLRDLFVHPVLQVLNTPGVMQVPLMALLGYSKGELILGTLMGMGMVLRNTKHVQQQENSCQQPCL